MEYGNTVQLVDVLAVAGDALSPDQSDYLQLLTRLIEDYDEAHVARPKQLRGIGALKFLLQQNNLKGEDLGRLLGVERSVAYRILRGERKLTVEHIAKISRRFKISADLFVR